MNLNHDNSTDGQYLKQRDHDKEVRGLLRSKNIDMLSNSANNVVNGEHRRQVEVPQHQVYNPPGSSGSQMARAGAAVFGDGFAGRPIRGMEKEFGKKVNNSLEDQF